MNHILPDMWVGSSENVNYSRNVAFGKYQGCLSASKKRRYNILQENYTWKKNMVAKRKLLIDFFKNESGYNK